MFERVKRAIFCVGCIVVLLGRVGILRVEVRCVVGHLVGWKSGRILLVTRILWGIRLV